MSKVHRGVGDPRCRRAGSGPVAPSIPLRPALLATVAAWAVCLSGAWPAQAGCTISGSTAECRDSLPVGDPGVVDGGIEFSPNTLSVDSLIVRHLDITPVGGRSGVLVRGPQDTGSVSVEIGSDVTITTTGRATGVDAFGHDGVSIVQNGRIDVDTASGVHGESIGGTVSILNGGSITVHGLSIQISGLRGYSRDGEVELRNTGRIDIDGSPIPGMWAGTAYGASLRLFNEGSIVAHGFGSVGMAARAGAGSSAVIHLENSSEVETAGMYAVGLTARHDGSGTIEIVNSGTVTTGYDESDAVRVEAHDDVVRIDNAGDLVTRAVGSSGILVVGTGNDTIEITNTGSIEVMEGRRQGVVPHGIGVSAVDGSVTIDNGGDIVTHADEVTGIDATSTGDAAVTIDSGGNITTAGTWAHGIHARTENGGLTVRNGGAIVTSGTGANGIDAASGDGALAVTNDGGGTITVSGADATGIVARGTGSATVSVTNAGDIRADGERAMGISATGLTVTVDSAGGIDMAGDDAVGIFARANDGGALEVTLSGTLSMSGDTVYGIDATALGEASLVVTNAGDMRLSGADAIAISANGGFAAQATMDVVNTGAIELGGADSTAVSAETGDGRLRVANTGTIGGDADMLTGLRVIGTGGGDISVDNGGDIILNGDGVQGVVLDGGLSAAAALSFANTGRISVTGGDATGVSASSDSATLSLVNEGEITADGDGATAMEAQSHAGAALTVGNAGQVGVSGAFSTAMLVEGTGETSVTNATGAEIAAAGLYATGLYASTDGGVLTVVNGGAMMVDGEGAQGVSASNLGSDATTVENVGEIRVAGTDAVGISAYVATGSLEIINGGRIEASGDGAVAIDAQANGGAVTLTIDGGRVRGGGGDEGRAIRITGAGTHLVDNSGEISAASGIAIEGGAGDESVRNGGTVRGSVLLGGGINAFENLASGIFESGERVELGDGGTLTNDGILTPGGDGTILSTRIVGDLVQTANGRLVIDIDETAAQATDTLTVTGSAHFAGLLVPNVIQLTAPTTPGSTLEFLVATADGGLIDDGLTVQDTVGYRFGLDFRGDELYLLVLGSLTVGDLVADAATPNQLAFVSHLDAGVEAGSAALGELASALLLLPDDRALLAAVNRLLPSVHIAHYRDALAGARELGEALLSCRMQGAATMETRTGSCVWMRLGVRRGETDAITDTPGFTRRGTSITGGVRFAPVAGWRLGVALGYERIRARLDDGAQTLARSEGDRLEAGLSVARDLGPLTAAVTVAGIWGWFDSERYVNLAGIGDVARSSQKVAAVTTRARLSHLLTASGPLEVRPMIDLAATYVRLGGYRESGGGSADLMVAPEGQWLFSITPAVEIDGRLEGDNGSVAHPYLRLGVTVSDKRGFDLQGRLTAAPTTVPSFTIRHRFDRLFGEVAAGLSLADRSGLSVSVAYDGRFSRHTQAHAGSLKVSFSF